MVDIEQVISLMDELGWWITISHWVDEPSGLCSCGNVQCALRGKHTLLGEPRASTKDPEQVRRWWHSFPEATPAVITGLPSGIWVLDLDCPAGMRFLRHYEAEFGVLPVGPYTSTPNGGRHIYFQWNPEQYLGTAVGVGAKWCDYLMGETGWGLDVFGAGGAIILPPTKRDGKCYKWEISPLDAPFPQAPQPLLDIIYSGVPMARNKWHWK